MSDDKAPIQELIQRAQGGDSEAIALIYQEYVDRIYRYCLYRVGLEADAEDLTAEVFVNMVEGLSRYKDTGAPFEAWLYRMASARVADFYQQRGRQPVEALPDDMAGSSPGPEEQMLIQQEIVELHAALSHLSEEEQEVLILRFVERRSHRAVAAILGKRVAAVKNIQYRALGRLAGLLGTEKQSRHYLRGENG